MVSSEQDVARGRKRSRSQNRSAIKSIRPDESSTLRGRSPRRATSPFPLPSRNASPSLRSPTSHILLHNQLRRARREHCPSRAPSPNDLALRRRTRTRSRSRGRSTVRVEHDVYRSPDVLSGLRNEIRLQDGERAPGTDKSMKL